ncbi:hypothetical protein EDC96DRAFT_306713 [Choanephora cucurbitarum]|nr:hypothetical protein EDC96DRAFT_306713 [Choanephora cucurbitarum]
MTSPLFVIGAYASLAILIPFVLYNIRIGDIVLQIAYYFHADYYLYKVEPIMVCLGVVTFYCYVVMGTIYDMIQSLHRHNQMPSYVTTSFLLRFERAYTQLRTLFPSFVIACALLYTNTTRFDTQRNSFMILQTLLLLVQPLATLSSHGSLCKYAFRITLGWALVYALFPRQSYYWIAEISHTMNDYLGFNAYHPHITHSSAYRYDHRYKHENEWIL